MRLFRNKPKYYIEVVRMWEWHSYDTTRKAMTYSHPVFLVKKRNLFKKDEIVKKFYYTSRIEEALEYVRIMNGGDFIPNEEAIEKYGTHVWWDENNDSGTYINS